MHFFLPKMGRSMRISCRKNFKISVCMCVCVSSTPDVLSTLVNTPPPSTPSPSARPERRLVLLTRQGHPVRHSRWGMDPKRAHACTHAHLAHTLICRAHQGSLISQHIHSFPPNLRLHNVNTDSLEQHRFRYCHALTHIRRLSSSGSQSRHCGE